MDVVQRIDAILADTLAYEQKWDDVFIEAKAEIQRLRTLAWACLDARRAESMAHSSLRIAEDNYSDPSPEQDAFNLAALAALKADQELLAVLTRERLRTQICTSTTRK